MNDDSMHPDPHGCGGQAAPYVLGALPEDELIAFRAHMGSCSICRDEVAALQVVGDALPAVAPQLSAPPELKSRVMAEVAREAAMHRSSQPARARERPARRGLPSWLGARPGLALAAAAGALALALIVLVPGGGGHGTRLIRAEVHAPHAYASVKLSGGHAVLNITGLPQTPAQRVYEVWIKRSGEPQPTDALFTVTSRGDATVGVPGSISGVKLIMVTSEPLGGSLKPTSSPVIVAKLA